MTASLRPELAAEIARRFPGASVATMVADASTRRFHRLTLSDGSTCVVMDYGAPFEGETDDIRLARIFERAELPVARVLEGWPSAGALVLEDLGDDTLERVLSTASAEKRRDLYAAAVGLTGAIAIRGSAALAASDRAGGPALDEARFRFEMSFFLEHYVGTHLGRFDCIDDLREPLAALARETAAHPRVLCHRDYHSRNIMVRADGGLAMVDIQDARWGPDTYDLASLLRDAYVDIDEGEVDRSFEQFADGSSDRERGALRSRFDLVAIERMIKALGTFGYQVAVLGRERYRGAIPRTLRRLSVLIPRTTHTVELGNRMMRSGLLEP